MSIAIHWFRRDLRIADNSALNAAGAAHDQVVPVYVLSEWKGEHHWCGAARQEFLCGCLRSLAKNLEAKVLRVLNIRKSERFSAFKIVEESVEQESTQNVMH